MPLEYRHKIESLNGIMSNAKAYIDFGANTYEQLLKIAKNINSIL